MNLNEHFDKMVRAANDQLQEKLQELGKELNRLRDVEKEKKQADRTIEKLSARIVVLQMMDEHDKAYRHQLEQKLIDLNYSELVQILKEEHYR